MCKCVCVCVRISVCVWVCRYTAFDLCCVCLYTIWWLVLMDRKREMMFTVPSRPQSQSLSASLPRLMTMTTINATMTAQSVFDHLPRQLAVKMLIYMLLPAYADLSRSSPDTHTPTHTLHRTAALTTLQTCLRFLLRCENARFFRVK